MFGKRPPHERVDNTNTDHVRGISLSCSMGKDIHGLCEQTVDGFFKTRTFVRAGIMYTIHLSACKPHLNVYVQKPISCFVNSSSEGLEYWLEMPSQHFCGGKHSMSVFIWTVFNVHNMYIFFERCGWPWFCQGVFESSSIDMDSLNLDYNLPNS